DEPRDPMHEHARLAGARAGEHHERPIAVLDGRALLGVQADTLHLACLAREADAENDYRRVPDETRRLTTRTRGKRQTRVPQRLRTSDALRGGRTPARSG